MCLCASYIRIHFQLFPHFRRGFKKRNVIFLHSKAAFHFIQRKETIGTREQIQLLDQESIFDDLLGQTLIYGMVGKATAALAVR